MQSESWWATLTCVRSGKPLGPFGKFFSFYFRMNSKRDSVEFRGFFGSGYPFPGDVQSSG